MTKRTTREKNTHAHWLLLLQCVPCTCSSFRSSRYAINNKQPGRWGKAKRSFNMARSSARSRASLPASGYDCDFVDAVPMSEPESLSCPVCFLPFRNPHLVSCCGAKYCEPCIDRVKAADQRCPLCKQQFNTMLDKSFQRKVLDLKVRCSRKKDGCEWEGELRHLSNHERRECGWALVECRYRCGERVSRCQLSEHERNMCPRRPMNVKMESVVRKVCRIM